MTHFHLIQLKLFTSMMIDIRVHMRMNCIRLMRMSSRPFCSHPSATSSLHLNSITSSETDWQHPLSSEGKVVAALGKFDAMHLGHRALAIRASQMDGQPCLLSFSGMAEVLGWPNRLPLVASCDRPRVLHSWTSACEGKLPIQRTLPFQAIRTMAPSDFVKLLAKKLGAAGVVAGSNYRFGYKAKGDARMLMELGAEYGLQISIEDLIQEPEGFHAASDGNQQISSSSIRELLSRGHVRSVARLLGRCYRLVIKIGSPSDSSLELASLVKSRCLIPIPATHDSRSHEQRHSDQSLLFGGGDELVTLPSTSTLNLTPGPGSYQASLSVVTLVLSDEQEMQALPLELESGCGIPIQVTVDEQGDVNLSQDLLAAAVAAAEDASGSDSIEGGAFIVIDFISEDDPL